MTQTSQHALTLLCWETIVVEMCTLDYMLRRSPILVVQYTYDFVRPTIFITNEINDLTVTGW